MNIRAVTHMISFLVGVTSLAMLGGAGVSFHYGERLAANGLLAAAGVSLLAAAAAWFLTRGKLDITRRDGFGICAERVWVEVICSTSDCANCISFGGPKLARNQRIIEIIKIIKHI